MGGAREQSSELLCGGSNLQTAGSNQDSATKVSFPPGVRAQTGASAEIGSYKTYRYRSANRGNFLFADHSPERIFSRFPLRESGWLALSAEPRIGTP